MTRTFVLIAAAALAAGSPALAQDGPSDAEIAHIAYTAGALDVAAAKQALAKSQNPAVREFAETMLRDHQAVNDKAVALVTKLGVTPAENAISAKLSSDAKATEARLAALDGAAFDRAYAVNEAAYHQAVNAALSSALIPSADNEELKALLETGLTLFREHQTHAEHLAADLK